MEQKFLLYDARLKERARNLRKNQTMPEKIIWDKILRNKQFFWYKFTRQKMLEFFIVDFYCSELRLVIEIDWDSHFDEKWIAYDIERTNVLNKLWLKVIRYNNDDVMKNLNWIYEDLKKILPVNFLNY